jgi:hypothetical protein
MPIGELVTRLIEIRLAGHCRPDLLTLSSSHPGPLAEVIGFKGDA